MLSKFFTRWTAAFTSVLALTLALASPAGADTIVDYGSTWNFHIGTSEASLPDPAAWRLPSFDDSSWSRGPAPIGYSTTENDPAEQNIATQLPTSGSGGYLSVYLRHTFEIQSPKDVEDLSLIIQFDDGYALWLNGHELDRHNVPVGDLRYNTSAVSPGEPTVRSMTFTDSVSEWLVPGTNLLAIHLFNANSTSSDLLVDLTLSSSTDLNAPTVVEVFPPRKSIVRELSQIEVVFNESVSGVDASDLLINGQPAAGMDEISPREYAFSLESPEPGAVAVSWSASHQIRDLASQPNAFEGGSWTYQVDPSAPVASVNISEFLADNENGIRDDQGNRSDWIELFNRGGEAVDLNQWSLTDDPSSLTKWRFPPITLASGDYLLIWSSGANRTNPAAPLHTNFRLNKNGEYLALVDPETNVVSAFAPFPSQRRDISYGTDIIDPALSGFLPYTTPGEPNPETGPGFAPAPVFSLPGGVYTDDTLTLNLTAASGEIRYTRDGSVPTKDSFPYRLPLSFGHSTIIKARVFEQGLLPGPVVAHSYILLDPSAAGFSSPLPVMILSTPSTSIRQNVPPGQERTVASLAALDTYRGRSSLLGTPDYLGMAEIEVRGQTSAGFPKKPYNLELQTALRQDLDTPLLGLPADSDWVLNNPYSAKPFLQNFLAFELHEKMGHYAPRRRIVELFVRAGSGRVRYPQDYAGVYLLLEKIKIHGDRVDLERLTPYHNEEPEITGGYIFKKDKNSTGDLNFNTSGGGGFSGQALKIHDPKPREITPQQLAWLRNHLNEFESGLYSSRWRDRASASHYSNYINVDSFVDYHWIVEFAKQIDGYRLSNYMHKDRHGKIHMSPIWDWNLSFGNADYLDGWSTSGWYWRSIGENQHIWLRRLLTGTTSGWDSSGDPDFIQKVADRWSVLSTNIMNDEVVLARIDELAALLDEPAQRDFQRWPRLGNYVWPNPDFYVRPTSYQGIIGAMKTWVQGRYNWIDSQFLTAPQFSHPGGRVPPGFSLSITGSSILYTLDGNDPRSPGGAPRAGAKAYTGPITLTGNARVVARARDGTRWSGPAAATFVLDPIPLRISEVMFHPPEPPAGSPFSDNDFEFIELHNDGAASISLANVRIEGGIQATLPDYTLAPGARALLVKNRAAFVSRYGPDLPVAGIFEAKLSNSGETFSLIGPLEEPIARVRYSDEPVLADGHGFSLVPAGDHSLSGNATRWRHSARVGGSPGAPDPEPLSHPPVVINELLAHPEPGFSGQLELHNTGGTQADISHWLLTDDLKSPAKFAFPPGTGIDAAGFLNLPRISPPLPLPFPLQPSGGKLWLLSANEGGELTGYIHGVGYSASPAGTAQGRHLSASGAEHFSFQTSPTPGAPNAAPFISPLVITEIMYRPKDIFANGAYWNNTEHEFIELYNRSNTAFDLSSSAVQWRIRGDVDFTLPPQTLIPAGSRVLLLSFDPEEDPRQLAGFLDHYNLPSSTPVLGPYRGKLSNDSGRLQLETLPKAKASSSTPPVSLWETIDFTDTTPWPEAADGLGFSLQRLNPEMFSNDPTRWQAASPTPVSAFEAPSAPVILSQPLGGLYLQSSTVTLRVAAMADGPLQYQWRLNSRNIPGATNATLTLTNLHPSDGGRYTAVVATPQTAVTSRPAHLAVAQDSDSDGMSDDWELASGLDPFNEADQATDHDQDGLTALQEFHAGSNPNDGSSALHLTLTEGGSGIVLSFPAAPYRTYILHASDTIPSSSWQQLHVSPAHPETRTITVPISPTDHSRFFQLSVPR